MSALVVAALALAGGTGAVVRFVVDGEVRSRLAAGFPWATLLINVTGSLVLGLLTGLMLFHSSPTDLKAIVGTGFCGGYTTFSTASVETVRLVQRGAALQALANLAASTLLSVGAAALGILLTR